MRAIEKYMLALNQYGLAYALRFPDLDKYIVFQPQRSDKGRPRQIEPSCPKKHQPPKNPRGFFD